MKILQDIANLIEIRNHMALSVNNETIKLSRADLKSIDAQVRAMDKVIIEQSLKLDFTNFGKSEVETSKRQPQSFTRTSTEDTEVVARKFGITPKAVVDSKGLTTIEAPADEDTDLSQ